MGLRSAAAYPRFHVHLAAPLDGCDAALVCPIPWQVAAELVLVVAHDESAVTTDFNS